MTQMTQGVFLLELDDPNVSKHSELTKYELILDQLQNLVFVGYDDSNDDDKGFFLEICIR